MAEETSHEAAADSEAQAQLAAAIAAAESEPQNEEHWDLLEEIAEQTQRPDELGALYRKMLQQDLGADLAETLGRRAAGFHEEWFAEDSPHLAEVLQRVLELSPEADWALQRLTVLLTVGERWSELLALYDRSLAAARDDARREQLLEEAAQLAKDFAGAPDRAIGYLQRLLELRPGESQLVRSLERLLERQGRWEELIGLWRRELEGASQSEALSVRGRIAACYLDHLGDGRSTLREVEGLLEDGAPEEENLSLLERVVALEGSPADVREGALALLRDRYESAGRSDDVIRAVTVALSFAGGATLISLHRELGRRIAQRGEAAEAMSHWAAVLRLDPGAEDAQSQLATLAQASGTHAAYADALVAAADAADAGPRQYALLVEAGDVRAGKLDDGESAIGLYQRVLAAEALGPTKLTVGRRLQKLLGKAERPSERLEVLEGLAHLETDPVERRRVLGQCARLAERLDEGDRALGFWQQRLEADTSDLEALDAMIELTGRLERWERHVDALGRRVAAEVPRLQRRLDLARIAETQSSQLGQVSESIATWHQIQEEFGEDAETVDALFELLVRAERHEEIYGLLQRAVSRDAARAAEVLARVGEVCRAHLGRGDEAAKAYHRAIVMEPGLARAQEGLRSLLDDESAKASAVTGLAKAYELTDDWQAILQLLPARLDLALGDDERVELLREAATLSEARGEDLSAAFESARQALSYAPASRELEAEVVRLAEGSDRWADAAEALGGAAEALASSRKARAAELLRRRASILERLDDNASALDACLSALELVPHDVQAAGEAIWLGAASGRWDGAGQAIVATSIARSEMQPGLLEKAESLADEHGAFGPLAVGLAGAIPEAGAIDGVLGRALEGRVAGWLSGRADDPEGAEAALLRGLAHEGAHTDTLRELARLQWRAPSRALVDTLLALAGNSPDDLDPLHDAARIAIDPVGDTALAGTILDRLLRVARGQWEDGRDAGGERPAPEMAVWALDELVRMASEAGEHGRAVDLLVSGARMPVAAARSREMRRRAGELCREQLGDRDRALRLLQSVVDESVEDAVAVRQLGVELEERGRLPELLALRQRQLGLDLDAETRLDARLEVARVLGLIEAQGGRIAVLSENLAEHPGHESSVEQLAELYLERGRTQELSDLYTVQAGAVEAAGETARAANLWARAAELFESRLHDVDGALAAHRRVVALSPTVTALDSLARLHMERDEPAVAAEWLARRLEGATEDERGAVALRLADAHLAAGHIGSAMSVLSTTINHDPTASAARAKLAVLYRDAEQWEPLAQLLSSGAPHEPEESQRLAYVREAAQLYESQLGRPELAIPVLQMGIELAPDDKSLKSKLATGLRVAGRLEESKEILSDLLTAFGRRRSPERAAVHYQLAQVAHASGDLDDAMAQLEKARKMDMSHPGILRMAGRMAHEAGELEKAEKAYRALLLVLRRQDPGAEGLEVGASEVLYELSLLATAQGDAAQSNELLETALSTAAAHDAETVRFKHDLLNRGEVALALSVVEARLENVESGPSKALMLGHRAAILSQHLDRAPEAFESLLGALELAPSDAGLHAEARRLAKAQGETSRYVDTLRAMADGARRKDEAEFRARTLLRLGEVTEHDVADYEAAAEIYATVEQQGVCVVEAWQAMARVADARGLGEEEVRVLRMLVDADGQDVPGEARTRALYRIAEIELSAGRTEEGLDTLRQGLDREARYAQAGSILQAAAELTPDSEDLFYVYEDVARASGDTAMILDYLERRVRLPDGNLEHIREGVERADELELPDRAEALLRRGVDLARDSELGLRDSLWIPTSLAQRRAAAGDIPGAIEWQQAGAEVADGDEAVELWMKVAEYAAMEGGDLTLAAQTYRSLLENDPANRALWEPLASVFATLEDRDGLEEVVSSTLDALLDPADRNELRMFYANYLLDVADARDEAIYVFKNVLEEDPDHAASAQKLAEMFEETGDNEQLVELLERQLDRARDREDVGTIVQLSLQMGRLIEGSDPDAAKDFYRGGLDWDAKNRELLQALLSLTGDEADPAERAELMERLLSVSEGEAGAALASDLIALYQSLDDEFGALRALDLGFRAHPNDESLRSRLEAHYREREEWSELASMMVHEAKHRDDVDIAVARGREAAALYRDTLQNPAEAAEAVRAAWGRRPEDLDLLGELVTDLTEAGLPAAGAEDVARALEQYEEPTAERAALLRMRARLELAVGDAVSAVGDLEQAYTIDEVGSAQELINGLDALRNASPDHDTERSATHRLAAVLIAAGNEDDGRDVLAEWIQRSADDIEALRWLRQIDTGTERWADVAAHNERLLRLEDGEAQVTSALGLLQASRLIEQPEDARSGLEHVFGAQPDNAQVRDALKSLYEETAALRELAELVLAEAESSEGAEARFAAFRRVGDLRIQIGDAEGALAPLAEAAAIQPDDHELTILLADAYMGTDRLQEAVELLQVAIGGFTRRRSPQLAAMQLRMARIAGLSGDAETQKEWLGVALDADKNNGEVAAELAELAMELGDDDTALKALRVVTLQKTPGPMSKAMAFLRQAQIAQRQGDHQKAVLWARRARLEDDSLEEAHQFLAELGEA